MELLTLPRLRNKELQTVGENSVRICGEIVDVKPAIDKVTITLNTFKEGMQKELISAGTKKDLDYKRDNLVSGLITNIKAESLFPHPETIQETLLALLTITKKYTGIGRLPYNEETAAIDNMMDELSKLDLEDPALAGITRWFQPISDSNNAFKAAGSEYIESTARLSETSPASAIAPELSEDLENLYTLMFAHAKIGANPAIVTAYKELEVLIKSIN